MRFFLPAIFLLLSFSIPFASVNNSTGAAQANSTEPPALPDVQNTIFVQAVFSNGTSASSLPIVLLARSNKSETVYRTITDSSGKFILLFDKGDYQLDSLIDLPSTSGMDFASTAEFSVPSYSNLSMIFYPAGSLAGSALDAGSPVSGAAVRVSCPSAAFDYSRINGGTLVQAGEAGDFLFRALPVGTCIISASKGNLAGSAEAQVLQGRASSASLAMKAKSVQSDGSQLWIAGAAVFILLALAYFFATRKNDGKAPAEHIHPAPAKRRNRASKKTRSRGKPAEPHSKQAAAHAPAAKHESAKKEESDISNPKAAAVLSTLSEREREIAVYLLKNNGRAKRSQLQHKLLIPKTSLLRNLRSLERKNIVKLTPFGRNLLAQIDQSLFN